MAPARRGGKRVGYIRVSSVDQNELRQLDGVQLDKKFTDKASGKNEDRKLARGWGGKILYSCATTLAFKIATQTFVGCREVPGSQSEATGASETDSRQAAWLCCT